jgi:hypothetical protein
MLSGAVGGPSVESKQQTLSATFPAIRFIMQGFDDFTLGA